MLSKQWIEDNSIPEPNTGCWLWTGSLNGRGYANNAAHRQSYASHHGPIPKGIVVRHKCDQPSCVNPGHLELGTYSDNANDMIRRGRYVMVRKLGEAHPRAKLTEAQVVAMRSDNRTQKEIASDYGVTRKTVSAVKARKRWRHLA
jgi:hypothetical protein